MKLHEYQAKQIFRKYGIATPEGIPAFSAQEARAAYEKSGFGPVMVKAQVLAGGRGKAGGIQKASNADEVQKTSAALIGQQLKTYQSGAHGETIRAVLIEKRSEFQSELYLGIVIDRSRSLPSVIFSEAGGMDIEEVASKTPERVQRIAFDPTGTIDASLFMREWKLSAEMEGQRAALSEIAAKCARIFIENDCQLLEVNPLVVTKTGLMALDAKIAFDDNALFRHADWEALRDPQEDDEKEKRAKKSGLSYISLHGNIGCLVNGAGLAMATMDSIKAAGGEPANFLDVGGGATKDQVLEAFRIILQDPLIRAVFVNIFGGIMKCDIIAQALVDATSEMDINVPVVVRLEGTRVEEGRALLKSAKVTLHSASTMDEAARLVVKLAKNPLPVRS